MFTVSDLQSLQKQYPQRNNIGEYTYGNPTLIHYDKNTTLTIGKFCSIADKVTIILGGEHDTHKLSTYPFHILMNKAIDGDWKTSKGNITIGNDVWIGYGTTILSGVTVGDGAIIGAQTLVSKDVEPYEIVVGNPQKHIRYRFNANDRKRLLKLAWWEQPDEILIKMIPLLLQDDIDKLEEIVFGM